VPAAVPLTVLLIAFEVSVAALVLSKGQRVRLGLLAAVAFQIGLAPLLSWYELANVPLVALALLLLGRDTTAACGTGCAAKRKEAAEMIRTLLGLFVIAHGLITFGIWAAPLTEQAPFHPNHSWLLGDTRTLAVALAVVAAIALVVTGGGFLANQDWWAAAAVTAGAVAVG
jgi:hypothetical protein